MNTTPIVIATDGACQGNPGPAGWAWVTADGEWESAPISHGTNNIAELMALLHALLAYETHADVTLEIDSAYVINGYSTWMHGWARNGWVTAAGSPVANAELFEELLASKRRRADTGLPPVKLVKVKGHSGHILNAWADILAVGAAQRAAYGLTTGLGTPDGNDPVDTSVLPEGATIRKPRRKR